MLGALAGAAAATTLPRRANADPIPLRLGVGGADAYAEGFYGVDQGTFAKAGLAVELTNLGSGGAIATAVAGNALDVGLSNTANIAIAVSHGAPFTIVAGAGLYTAAHPTVALMVSLDSPLQSAKDLVGKTVAVTALKDLTEVGTRAWLEKNGVDPASVKFIEQQMAGMSPGLEHGTFDAAVLGEPYLSAARGKTLRVLGYVYDAIGPQFLIANWFTTTDALKNNTAAMKRLAGAVYETARWANADQAASGTILSKYTKMDPAVVASMTRVEYALSLDPKYIDPVLAAMYKYEAVDRRLTTADLVAPAFR